MQRLSFAIAGFLSLSLEVQSAGSDVTTAADLIEMDFEDLVKMDVEIRSAGKSATRAMDLPYAAHVLTGAEIRQRGVQTIPDALRLIPGVNVSQISAAEWSVGIRGGGGRFSRYVLVIVDGRIAFNNVFSGVNWDELNISLDQISRIEVIRGPNAASWGANAVNGIINIITAKSESEPSRRISVWGGHNHIAGVSANLSRALAANWTLGLAAHVKQWGGLQTKETSVREEGHKNGRTSFTLEKIIDQSHTYLTADLFVMEQGPNWKAVDTELLQVRTVANIEDKHGWTLQANHTQELTDRSYWRIRTSAESTDRNTTLYQWDSTNFQLDLEFGLDWGVHQLAAGINGRYNESTVDTNSFFDLSFSPATRSVNNFGVYLSDGFNLSDRVNIVLAARLDDSELSAASLQPSIRLLWQASEQDRFWFALSKATTTPARALVDINDIAYAVVPPTSMAQPLPLLVVLDGYASRQDDTSLTAVEAGYRHTFSNFSLDFSVFDFEYENEVTILTTGVPEVVFDTNNNPLYLRQNAEFINQKTYGTRGGEILVRGQMTSNWSTQLNVSYVENKTNRSLNYSAVTLLNTVDLALNKKFSFSVRNIRGQAEGLNEYEFAEDIFGLVDDYWVLDSNFVWSINQHWQTELAIHNLGPKHSEAMREQFAADIMVVDTSAIVKLNYNF